MVKECVFDNMTLYFECRVNKNALLQTTFLVILPTGWKLRYFIFFTTKLLFLIVMGMIVFQLDNCNLSASKYYFDFIKI